MSYLKKLLEQAKTDFNEAKDVEELKTLKTKMDELELAVSQEEQLLKQKEQLEKDYIKAVKNQVVTTEDPKVNKEDDKPEVTFESGYKEWKKANYAQK